MQTGNADYIYKNDLNKACFQHDMAYKKKTQSGKVLKDKAFASNPKYDSYQIGLASMVHKFFDKTPTKSTTRKWTS